MYKKGIYEIAENIPIADKTYKMRLLGYTGDIKVPGQFINIRLSHFFIHTHTIHNPHHPRNKKIKTAISGG